MILTQADIHLLRSEPSAEQRITIAKKITDSFNSGEFNGRELLITHEILRLLIQDTEVGIRKLLSEELKDNLHLPHDIALKLANDIAEVAIPVVQNSYVLSEEDLIAIALKTEEISKLLAISARDSLSEELSDTLINKDVSELTQAVLKNPSASLSEDTIKALISPETDEDIFHALVAKGGLTIQLVESLFHLVSDELKVRLKREYKLPIVLAYETGEVANDNALGKILPVRLIEQEFGANLDQLYTSGRLNHSVIIRSLCIGDMEFFVNAMAKLSDIPLPNAKILALDPGPLGFHSLYKSSGLPEVFFDSIKTLLELALRITDYGRYRREDYPQRLIEEITVNGYDTKIENMSYLLNIIGRDTQYNAANY
jgi:uncharacterized protein (DUF2336 family)